MTELSVFSSIGVRSAAEQLFRKFEQQNGSRLVVTWGTAADAGRAHRGR